jgi:hypothetical protein
VSLAPGDDVVVQYSTRTGDRLVRHDGQTMQAKWSWSFETPVDLRRYIATTETAVHVLMRRSEESSWTDHAIDGSGTVTTTAVTGFENGSGGGAMWPLPDGSLFALGRYDNALRKMWYRPETQVIEVDAEVFTDEAVRGWDAVLTSGHFLGSFLPSSGEQDASVFAWNAAGEQIIPTTEVPLGMSNRQAAIVDGDLITLTGPTLQRAPIGNLRAVTRLSLPVRPGGSIVESYLHGAPDGRVFAVWHDQRSTFDMVLRIGRLH